MLSQTRSRRTDAATKGKYPEHLCGEKRARCSPGSAEEALSACVVFVGCTSRKTLSRSLDELLSSKVALAASPPEL